MSNTTLYCFKVNEDEDAIKIHKYEINDYNYVKKHEFRKEYSFPGKVIGSPYRTFVVNEDNIDKYVLQRVFTFDSSYKHAIDVIEDKLKEQIEKSERYITNWKQKLDKLDRYSKEKLDGHPED